MEVIIKLLQNIVDGSDSYKQVYIYGGLDRSPTTLTRAFGFSWGSEVVINPFRGKIGQRKFQELRQGLQMR